MGFLPDNYKSAIDNGNAKDTDKKNRYFEPKQLKDGEVNTFRLCGLHESGHVIAGYSYFTMEGRPKRFPTFPENYQDDIGLSWEGKTNNTGEKDKPRYFLSFVALNKESDEFLVYTFQTKNVRSQLEETLKMEDYQILPSGLANFYLTLRRRGTGTDTSYTLLPTLKAPTKADEKRWQEVSSSIWLPALFVGADPFTGKPAGGIIEGLPPTHRDELGADHEIATAETLDPVAVAW